MESVFAERIEGIAFAEVSLYGYSVGVAKTGEKRYESVPYGAPQSGGFP